MQQTFEGERYSCAEYNIECTGLVKEWRDSHRSLMQGDNIHSVKVAQYRRSVSSDQHGGGQVSAEHLQPREVQCGRCGRPPRYGHCPEIEPKSSNYRSGAQRQSTSLDLLLPWDQRFVHALLSPGIECHHNPMRKANPTTLNECSST